jgi:hypothetical protein
MRAREHREQRRRGDFDFRSKWAVSIDDVMRYLNELQPTIAHFSGHANHDSDICIQVDRYLAAGLSRDIINPSDASLQLQGEQHEPQYIGAYVLPT